MLKTNFENYPKGERFISLLEDFLDGRIFNSDGELLKRFAFDNVCKLAFNVDQNCLGSGAGGKSESTDFDSNPNLDQFMQAFEEAATLISGRFLYAFQFMLKIKTFFNVGSERRLKKSISTVHSFAGKIIKSRISDERSNNRYDLLSLFIGIPKNTNSPNFLRDIVISIILASRDSTSSALTWFFWLLSSRPHVERAILKELEMIRACLNNDVLPDGTAVGKGWFVTYHAYAIWRMERI
ncbi:hypothetical protein ACFXTH_015754 [Malus domestica]